MGAEQLVNTGFFRYSGGHKVLDCKEAKALNGTMYGSANVAASVAASASIYLQFNTPDDRDVIVTDVIARMQDGTTTKGALTITEAPTFTTGSTALTPRNFNRQIGDNAQTTIFTDPTSISGGTTIFIDTIFGTRGAESENVFPAKLKRDTTYIATFTNNSTGAADMILRVIFGECEPDA